MNVSANNPAASIKISLAIPTISQDHLAALLETVAANTLIPEEIIIVDNGASPGKRVDKICKQFSSLPIKYLPQKTNIGVNAAWNLALSVAEHDLLSILNDDVILPDRFFEMVIKVFEQNSKAGFVVPNTVKKMEMVGSPEDKPTISNLSLREGWAFTVRKNIMRPIPAALHTFYGDDWFFQEAKNNAALCFKIMNVRIFHHMGISRNLSKAPPAILGRFQSESKTWAQMQNRDRRVAVYPGRIESTYDPSSYWEIQGLRHKCITDETRKESIIILNTLVQRDLLNASILEVGQGQGATYSAMTGTGAKIPNYRMVDFVGSSRYKCKALTGITPDGWDGKILPYTDNSFDMTISTDVMLHVPVTDIDNFVREHVRVSKTWMVVSSYVGHPDKEVEKRKSLPGHTFLHDYDALWEENGMVVVEKRVTGDGLRCVWILKKKSVIEEERAEDERVNGPKKPLTQQEIEHRKFEKLASLDVRG